VFGSWTYEDVNVKKIIEEASGGSAKKGLTFQQFCKHLREEARPAVQEGRRAGVGGDASDGTCTVRPPPKRRMSFDSEASTCASTVVGEPLATSSSRSPSGGCTVIAI